MAPGAQSSSRKKGRLHRERQSRDPAGIRVRQKDAGLALLALLCFSRRRRNAATSNQWEIDDHGGAWNFGGFDQYAEEVAMEEHDGDMLVDQSAPQIAQPLNAPELPAKEIVQACNVTHLPMADGCATCRAAELTTSTR